MKKLLIVTLFIFTILMLLFYVSVLFSNTGKAVSGSNSLEPSLDGMSVQKSYAYRFPVR